MNFSQNLIDAANDYCDRTGFSRKTIGNRVMNDGKFFDRIESGAGCTIETYQKVMAWFAEHSNDSRKRNKSNNSNTSPKTGTNRQEENSRGGEIKTRHAPI